MRVVAYQTPKPISADDALVDLELPRPAPIGRDLLIEVKAVSINPVDIKIRNNVAPAPGTPKVLGWDASGVVVEAGPDSTIFKPGDAVFYAGAVDRSGCNAQFHLVDERLVGPKPRTLGFAQAAAIPLTAITAWETLFDRLDIRCPIPGAANAVLIIGAAGGVGSMAVQLARRLTDLTVIGTASRLESRQWVEQQGAHHVIDHGAPLAPQIAALGLGQPGFVFSTTHTEAHIRQVAELIAPQGRFALIDDPLAVDILPFKRKSVSIHWELMFTRSLFATVDMIEQHKLLAEVSRLIDEKRLGSTLRETLRPICAATIRQAHAMVESDRTIGKIVVADWPQE